MTREKSLNARALTPHAPEREAPAPRRERLAERRRRVALRCEARAGREAVERVRRVVDELQQLARLLRLPHKEEEAVVRTEMCEREVLENGGRAFS